MKGIYVCRIVRNDEKTHHVLAKLKPVSDGMMFEFHDLVTDDVVGAVGSHRVHEFCTPLAEWIDENARGI